MIKVALDGQSLYGKKSGLGVYTTALISAMKEFLPPGFKLDVFPEANSPFCGNLNTPNRLKWEVFEFPREVQRNSYDIAHVPAFSMGWPRAKTVLTVHDLIGMAFPNQKSFASQFYWGKWLPWAARRANHLIADSESTRSDLIRLLRIPEHKITLIYPSGHEAYQGKPQPELLGELRAKLQIKLKYFLCVGTLEPRKNLKRVIEAHALLSKKQKLEPASLVLVGAQDFARGQFYHTLFGKVGTLSKNIIFPGYLKNEELHALYAGAEALIFPSLYEGFGLPVLEAMASGCPVITSRATSLPEVAGDAALYVNPQSVESIADAMEIIYIDHSKREELIELGQQRLNFFSWKKTALQTFEVYRKVAHGS